MAPLIDCVFQLMIFFMLTSSFPAPVLKLTLPNASTREKVDPEQLVVSIDSQGQIFVNADQVKLEDLKHVLQSRLTKLERKQVNFRGDQNLRYQLFVRVMDIAKQAGAQQLNLVHENSSESTQ